MATNPVSKDATHVLIIGAGVTGLAIAHGLQKAGIPYTIFEHEPSATTYRPREWTMGLHWALPLLKSLLAEDLAAKLNETFVDPYLDWSVTPCDKMRMFNGLTGEILKDIPINGKIVRVSRRKLRAFLAAGIDVKYDHQLVDIKYDQDGCGATAVFANGNQEHGSLIVGTDGPKSAVRRLVFEGVDVETKPLDPVILVNVTYCVGDAEKAKFLRSTHPVWSMVMHPELFEMLSGKPYFGNEILPLAAEKAETICVVQDIPDPNKPETWNFQIASGWIANREDFPTAASRMAELKRKGAMLPEPFKSSIEWIPDDLPITFDAINYWESHPWDVRNGRVTLAGDAAHPMPPHRGQGLNHALQDAHNLVTLLGIQSKSSTPRDAQVTALQAYANEVAIRGSEEVALSKQNAFMVMDWKRLEQSPIFKHALDRSPVTSNGDEGKGDRKDSVGQEHMDPVLRERVESVDREITAIGGA